MIHATVGERRHPTFELLEKGMGDELAGKLALVTGAGAGVGRAVATDLAQRGARVVATDFAEARVQQLAAMLRARGLACEGRQLDVGDAEAVDMLVDELELEHPIELLANLSDDLDASVDASRAFRIHTDGVFRVARSVARRMKSRARGSIVIVANNSARVLPGQKAAHAASRAAAHLFAKGMERELAEHGVRCKVVAPGFTELPVHTVDGLHVLERSTLSLRRIMSAADIVQAVAFFLAEHARELARHDCASADHVEG